MANVVRIVLTGGPCGGKTSALTTLVDRLTRRGCRVACVPEAFTYAMTGMNGYDPAWAGTSSHASVQAAVLRFQLAQEEMFSSIVQERPPAAALAAPATSSSEQQQQQQQQQPCVLLLDRGALDGRVFCSDTEWASVLRSLESDDEQLLARYDLVVHMRTAAFMGGNHYQWGKGSNNEARMHSPEEARSCDDRCAQVYSRHAQHVIVDNEAAFRDKIGTVLSAVTRALERRSGDGEDLGGAARTKHRVSAQALDRMPLAERAAARVFDYTVTFLAGRGGANVRRGREVTEAPDAPEVRRWREGGQCEWVAAGGSGAGSTAPPGANDRYEQRVAAPGDKPREASVRSVISRDAYEAAIDAAQRRSAGTDADPLPPRPPPPTEADGAGTASSSEQSMLLEAATAAGTASQKLAVVFKRTVAFTAVGGHHCELVHYFNPERMRACFPDEVGFDRPQSMRECPPWVVLSPSKGGGLGDEAEENSSSEDDAFGAGGCSFTQEAAGCSPKRARVGLSQGSSSDQ